MKKIIITALLLFPAIVFAEEPSVRINEIAWMGTNVSSSDEWIELYNTTSEDIDLSGWTLEAIDGTPSIALEGIIKAGDYFLLERTDDNSVAGTPADQIYSGSIGNTGEHLTLKNNGSIVDEINASEGWSYGDNETKQTMERNDDLSWHTSENPEGTPREQNSTSPDGTTPTDPPDNPDEPDEPTQPQKNDIVINEVLPNPIGPDTEKEFIELKNISAGIIDLTNWTITTSRGQSFILPSLTMTPDSIVIFYRSQTGLALRNARETVKLKSTNGRIISSVNYSVALIDNSYQRNENGDYQWGEPSPKEDNTIIEIIFPVPFIEGPTKGRVGEILTFDASDSFDPENRPLEFHWDFGDGRTAKTMHARQLYTEPGKFTVQLKLLADQASSTETLKITISKNSETKNTTTSSEPIIETFETIPFIFISEFFPNPEGSDADGEFIEIFNQEEKVINLDGWKLDDAQGGSKPFILSGTINPYEYKAFFREETGLALNNSNEEIRLIAPDSTIVDLIPYTTSSEGKSFVLDENFIWQETSTPTPGEINILDAPKEKSSSTATTSGAILGSSNIVIEKPSPLSPTFVAAGISAATVLGLGALLKITQKRS